jgi:hypothetical protein
VHPVSDFNESPSQRELATALLQGRAEGIDSAVHAISAAFDETSADDPSEPLESPALEQVRQRVLALTKIVRESQTKEVFHATTGALMKVIRENDELRVGVRRMARVINGYQCAQAHEPHVGCEDSGCQRCSALAWADHLLDEKDDID